MNDPLIVAILTVVALGTSVISGIIGMGGGILLLAVIYTVLPQDEMLMVVPLHACVQLVSNFTRVLAFMKSVSWAVLRFFLLGALPGLVAGYFILKMIWDHREAMSPYMMVLVGLFILYVTYHKKKKGEAADDKPLSSFAVLGTYAAPISLLFGATGPLLAPYFIRKDLSKDKVVATKAMCQFCVHLLKIGIFYMLWKAGTSDTVMKYKDLTQPSMMLICLIMAAIVGTFVGKYFHEKVGEEKFKKLYFVVLNIAAFKILIFDGVLVLIP